MTATDERPREGWAMPGNATRLHYFRDTRALCRRQMFTGHLDGDGGQVGREAGPEDCRQCWRARKRELAS